MAHISSQLASNHAAGLQSAPRASPEHDAAFRQLRHQTKNALQRILCQIAQSRELQATRQAQHLMEDLERRVRLSATVSDALFGVVEQPGPLPRRLQLLCEATVDLLGDPDQTVRLAVEADAPCPHALTDAVLQISHELVGNAVKHGLYARTIGAITVRVVPEGRGAIRLQVVDDGWGFRCQPEHGEGLSIATALARQHGGDLSLERRNGVTAASVVLRAGACLQD